MRNEPEETARERFVHPRPRVNEALWLRDHGATALIDLSDGLVADATHLASASGVQCVIEAESVPVHFAAAPHDALAGGEDYELLLSLPAGQAASLSEEFRERFGLPLTKIGRIEPGEGVRVLRHGKPITVSDTFRHF
jgi:thiamine-monophosphate kinase